MRSQRLPLRARSHRRERRPFDGECWKRTKKRCVSATLRRGSSLSAPTREWEKEAQRRDLDEVIDLERADAVALRWTLEGESVLERPER